MYIFYNINIIFFFRLSFPRTNGSTTFQFLPLVLGKVAHILSNHLIITKHLSQLLQIRLQSKLNLHAYLFLFPIIFAKIKLEEIVSSRLKLCLVRIAETTVFCFQNCSSYRKKRYFWSSRLKTENLKKIEVTRTIYSISERLEQFLKQNAFLTYSWRFLRSTKSNKLEFKLEQIIGI